MEAANDIKVMKDAATRLQEFLKTRNIKVGHAVALEALSASLGSRNWRTLRDKLSEPVSASKVPPGLDLESLQGCRWTVHGHIFDGSEYGDYYPGETPLHAKIWALYDRMAEQDPITVYEVIDRLSDEVVDEDSMSLSSLRTPAELLKVILPLTERLFGPTAEIEADDEYWPCSRRLIQVLLQVLESESLAKDLAALPDEGLPELSDRAYGPLRITGETPGVVYTVSVFYALAEYRNIVKEHKDKLTDVESRDLCHFEVLVELYQREVAALLVDAVINPKK